MSKRHKKQNKKKKFIFSIVLVSVAAFCLAAFFLSHKTLASAVGWGAGIWNNYVAGHMENDPTVPPAIGWLSSRAGLASGCSGASYGVTLGGDEGDETRTVRGAAWFGIGSEADSGGSCQADSPSLGWLNFDQGSPSFCPGDCFPARWEKKAGGTGFEGTVKGWAQITSMMNMPQPDSTTAQNGWVRIYGAKVDSEGNVTTNENNYAWNSGEFETAIAGNSGLGWIKLDGLKINNCTGSVVCSTRKMCPGINFGDLSALPCTASELCSGNSEAVVLCNGRSWTCSNGCETCSKTVFDDTPEQGECGTFNGSSICGQEEQSDSYCKLGTKNMLSSSSIMTTWTCGMDACGSSGYQVTCSAKTRCGWIETNP